MENDDPCLERRSSYRTAHTVAMSSSIRSVCVDAGHKVVRDTAECYALALVGTALNTSMENGFMLEKIKEADQLVMQAHRLEGKKKRINNPEKRKCKRQEAHTTAAPARSPASF